MARGSKWRRCDVLEIGPGRGDFLFAMAAAYPERRIVAVELREKRYSKLVRRVDASGIRGMKNALLIHGDARLVVPRHIPEGSVEAIYILFPYPWPKRRHAFRRLLTREFLIDLATRLRPGGFLTLKTDVEPNAEWVRRNAQGISVLDEVAATHGSGPERIIAVETLYEQKR